jgi:hypothetical protein
MKLSIKTLSIITLTIMTLIIMTLTIMTISIMPICKMTLRITAIGIMTISITINKMPHPSQLLTALCENELFEPICKLRRKWRFLNKDTFYYLSSGWIQTLANYFNNCANGTSPAVVAQLAEQPPIHPKF